MIYTEIKDLNNICALILIYLNAAQSTDSLKSTKQYCDSDMYTYIYIYIFFQRNDIIHALCEINLKKKTFKQIQQNHNRTTSITLSQARRFLTKWTKQSTKWIILMKNISWSTRKKTIRLRKIYDTNLSSQRNSNLNITIDGLQNFRI